MPEYRAHFDAEVEFTNGGGLSASGFRIAYAADCANPDDERVSYAVEIEALIAERFEGS